MGKFDKVPALTIFEYFGIEPHLAVQFRKLCEHVVYNKNCCFEVLGREIKLTRPKINHIRRASLIKGRVNFVFKFGAGLLTILF